MIPRIAIFDIDGTLVKWRSHLYVWDFIFDSAALLGQNALARDSYANGELSYEDWHNDLFRSMQSAAMSLQSIRSAMERNLDPDTPTPKVVHTICKRFDTALILSGGLSMSLDVAAIQHSDFAMIFAHKLFFNADGHIETWGINPFGSDLRKVDGLRHICSTFNCTFKEVMYVGDGENDIRVINELNRAGGQGIALPPLSYCHGRLVQPHKRADSLHELIEMRFGT